MATLLTPYGRSPGRIIGGVTLGQPGPLADGSPAMGFDGNTGYIDCGTPSVLNLVGSVTVEAWTNWQPVANAIVFGGDYKVGYYANIDNLGELSFWTAGQNITSGPSITAGEWSLAVWATDNGAVTLYINGVLVASGSATPPQSDNTAKWIGNSPTVNSPFFGALAHVAVYDYALTPGQVQTHYNARTLTQPGAYTAVVLADRPVAYWPLTDTSGLWAHDAVLRAAV
jgi:hypothetical protein